jgi:hypothetical protein
MGIKTEMDILADAATIASLGDGVRRTFARRRPGQRPLTRFTSLVADRLADVAAKRTEDGQTDPADRAHVRQIIIRSAALGRREARTQRKIAIARILH